MGRVLTDAFCKSLKAPLSGRLEVNDTRCAGLAFRVTPAGVKSWAFRFRDPKSRKPSRATIGQYPDIGLSNAREQADDLRALVAAGVNPVDQKRRERDESPSRAFKALADRYMQEHAWRKKRPRPAREDERNLNKHVIPKWGKRDYREIRRADAVELIESIVSAGTHTAANRVHTLISRVFSFALDASLVEANPVARLAKRGKEGQATRVLSDDEIAFVWQEIVKPPVSRQVGLALRLALLTACRATEIAGAGLDEIHDLDGGMPCLHLPGSRVKNHRDHLVPLSSLAVAVVREALTLIPADSKYLFASPHKKGSPISGQALARAMSRFCTKLDGKNKLEVQLKSDPPSPHDLRRTAGTRLASLGVSKEDRDAVLNHARVDVGKRYDLYERAREKQAALNQLSALVESILEERSKS